jgi:hypothetical protein
MSEENISRKGYRSGNGNGNGKRGRGRPKGTRNKTKVMVKREALDKCREMVSIKAPDLTQRILDEEALLAFSDVRALFEPNSWELVPPSDLPDEVAKAVSSIQIVRKVIPRGKDQDPEIETTYKYTFWPKGQALERLSKHLGLYEKDNIQKPPPPINMYLEKAAVAIQAQQVSLSANGYEPGDT